MRHRKDHRKLSRTASHRNAMLRNQVTSLFTYGRIETTVAKAKESRRLAERLITYVKRGDARSAATTDEKAKQASQVHARRLVARYVRTQDIVKKLFDDIVPNFEGRQGGYTRILRTRIRPGDAGKMAILELVKSEEQIKAERAALVAAEESGSKKSRGLFGGRKKKEAATEETETTE